MVAAELNTIPLIISRWLNPVQVKYIKELGAETIVYKDSIYSSTYKDIIVQLRNVLGFPIAARDDIDDDYLRKKIGFIHKRTLDNLKEKQALLHDFLQNRSQDPVIRKALGIKSSRVV